MGKVTGGILGPFKGKVGAVVGSVVGGQNIVKSMPASYSDKNSQAQQTQRSTFRETLAWYKALAAAVSVGFRNVAQGIRLTMLSCQKTSTMASLEVALIGMH